MKENILKISYSTLQKVVAVNTNWYVGKLKNSKTIITGDSETIYECVVSDTKMTEFESLNPGRVKEHEGMGDVIAHILNLTSRIPKAETLPPSGYKAQFISHDYAQQISWMENSTRKTSVNLVQDAQDPLKWALPTPEPIICVSHGFVPFESEHQSYKPIVTSSELPLQEHSTDSIWLSDVGPNGCFNNFANGDADYGICYTDGYVQFKNMPTDPKITYYTPGDSTYTIRPKLGEKLSLTKVEIQFSTDAYLRQPLLMTIYGEVGKDPRLAPYHNVNGGPYPAGVVLPMSVKAYETRKDFIAGADASHPVLIKSSNANLSWRELSTEMEIYRWEYAKQATIALQNSWGNYITLFMPGDNPVGGWSAIGTVYARSEVE